MNSVSRLPKTTSRLTFQFQNEKRDKHIGKTLQKYIFEQVFFHVFFSIVYCGVWLFVRSFFTETIKPRRYWFQMSHENSKNMVGWMKPLRSLWINQDSMDIFFVAEMNDSESVIHLDLVDPKIPNFFAPEEWWLEDDPWSFPIGKINF